RSPLPGVGEGLVDQLVDDRVVCAAVPQESAPRTQPSPIPLRQRNQRELRAKLDPRREYFPQARELLPVGSERCTQNDVERDTHHRGHRREGLIASYAASFRRARWRSPESATIEFGPMTR